MGSFKLHLIKTDKFKTVAVKVIFRRPIAKDEITIRNILSDIIMQSSKNYTSKRDLTIKAQDLYAAELSTSNSRLGNYITTTFHLNVLNDKYTEKDNFNKAIKFLGEIIFNPDVVDNKFNREKLDIVKNNCRLALNSLKEDTANYSLIRMFEEFDSEAASSYRLNGYIEDLEKINEENLYEYYRSILKSDLVDIFVLGDIEEEGICKLFRECFPLKTLKKIRVPYLLEENAMFYGLPIFLATPEESEVMHHILNENGYELKGDAVVKKRWIPKVGEDFYYLVNKHDGIQAVKGRRFYEADSGYLDCFKTEQACQSACDKLNEFILTLPQE